MENPGQSEIQISKVDGPIYIEQKDWEADQVDLQLSDLSKLEWTSYFDSIQVVINALNLEAEKLSKDPDFNITENEIDEEYHKIISEVNMKLTNFDKQDQDASNKLLDDLNFSNFKEKHRKKSLLEEGLALFGISNKNEKPISQKPPKDESDQIAAAAEEKTEPKTLASLFDKIHQTDAYGAK